MQTEITKLEQALTVARENSDQHAEAETLSKLGHAHQALRDFQQATHYYEQASTVAQQSGDGRVLFHLAINYAAMGEYERAIQCGEQSIAINRSKSSEQQEVYRALSVLAKVYEMINDGRDYAQQSISYCLQALSVAQQLGSYNYQIRCLVDIGGVYSRSDNNQQAIQYYERARAIANENGDKDKEADVLTRLGRIYASIANQSQTVSCFEQALTLVRESGNNAEEISILNQIGRGYREFGNHTQALSFHKQAHALAHTYKDELGEGESLFELGRGEKEQGNLQSAIDYFQQAFTLVSEGNKQDWGRRTPLVFSSRLELVKTYEEIGNYEEALRLLEQELVDDPPGSLKRIQELEEHIASLRQKGSERSVEGKHGIK